MAEDGGDRESKLARELIESGGDVVGAAAGAALGTIGGPPGIAAGAVGGVAITRLVKRLGAELHERILGPRQRARAGAALAVAVERIRTRVEAGETPRDDGFFDASDGERAPADELLEGVLLHAANAYQDRKVPYLAALFASLAFRSDISPAYGHYLIRLADRLTYRQLCALAFFAERGESIDLTRLEGDRQERGHRPFEQGLGRELDELAGDLGVLGIWMPHGEMVRADRTVAVGSADGATVGGSVEKTDIGEIVPTSLGRTLYEVMELERIPDGDKETIFDLMAAPTRGNPGATEHPPAGRNAGAKPGA